MEKREKRKLRVIDAPRTGSVVIAPPVLEASSHTIDFACGYCDTILMHAEDGQVHNLVIRCTKCGTHNSTEE